MKTNTENIWYALRAGQKMIITLKLCVSMMSGTIIHSHIPKPFSIVTSHSFWWENLLRQLHVALVW